jgi:hypothetical protein
VVVLDKDDKPRSLETFTLAKSEAGFWALAAHPRKAGIHSGKNHTAPKAVIVFHLPSRIFCGYNDRYASAT